MRTMYRLLGILGILCFVGLTAACQPAPTDQQLAAANGAALVEIDPIYHTERGHPVFKMVNRHEGDKRFTFRIGSTSGGKLELVMTPGWSHYGADRTGYKTVPTLAATQAKYGQGEQITYTHDGQPHKAIAIRTPGSGSNTTLVIYDLETKMVIYYGRANGRGVQLADADFGAFRLASAN